MKLRFDFENLRTTEFGIGREDGLGTSFSLVPVDRGVQAALREMAVATRDAMVELAAQPLRYEPSEKHDSVEYVYLPLNDGLGAQLRQLHDAANLPFDGTALSAPANVFCYFARLTDTQGRRLTALRRATTFKGVLKSRLVRLVTDALTIIEDKVFKLDGDFDLLIDVGTIHILRPSGFEFAGKLQAAVLASVPENVKLLQTDLKFVDFTGVEAYATSHARAARYLASIRSQKQTKDIDRAALRKLCKDTGVEFREVNGRFTVADGHVMGFLEVLDRRRYELELVKGAPERFRASSRRKLEI